MRRFRTIAVVVLAVIHVAGAQAQSLVTEDLRIPMAAAGSEGLEAVLVKPVGTGRHPLVILSHGSPRDAADRPGMTARGMMPEALEFAKRGFVSIAVLRRGYGSSPGGWAEGFGSCDKADYASAGLAGAADLRAAITHLVQRPDVDPKTILAVGVSAGGFATVALTSEPPPGLVAAISFAGGRGSSGPDTVCDESALVAAFRAYGERSRVPMLWVYAENDHFFGPPLAKRLLTAFERGGGSVTFLQAPSYRADGHGLFSDGGRPIWTKIVDRFLEAHDLMPDRGEARGGATLDPPRQLSDKGRLDFQKYLDAAGHKAFAVSPGGGYAWRTARGTIEEATHDALSQCEALRHAACRLYAVDDAYSLGR